MKMKKTISIGIVSAILSGAIPVLPALADNGLTTEFSLDFDTYVEAVKASDGTNTYVNNGIDWTASANWSLIKGDNASPLTTTSDWDSGAGEFTNISDNAVISGWGGAYKATDLNGYDKYTLTDKGDGVYVGLTSSIMPAFESNQVNWDDVSVVADPTNASNGVMKLAPPAMENSSNIGSSLFGKNYVDVVGKTTKLSTDIYIDQDAGGARLMLVRDVDFMMSMQHALTYYGYGKTKDYMNWLKMGHDNNGYWYDAVVWEDGKVKLDGVEVADYAVDTWYSVDYSLDLTDINAAKQKLDIKDASGAVVVSSEKTVTMGTTSTLPNITQNSFALAEDANSYGLIFAATSRLFKPGTTATYDCWNGNRAESGTVVYLDNIAFAGSTEVNPTTEPTTEPTDEPTVEPTAEPTTEPTDEPTIEPTAEPTTEPTTEPTDEPTIEPTAEPTTEPTAEPTMEPSGEPVELVNDVFDTAKNLTTAFETSFEGATAATKATDGTNTYVNNGKEWTASANWSLIKGDNASPLTTTSAWDNGASKFTNISDAAVISGWGGNYKATDLNGYDKYTLSDRGKGIFIGLTSSIMPAYESNQVNWDDVSIVADPTNESNSVMKLAPSVMENSNNVGTSMFGKNYVEVLGKLKKLSTKVYIDQDSGELRLMLVRDVDFLMSMQHAFTYAGYGKDKDYMGWLKMNHDFNGYWYDAVVWEDGKVKLDGEAVGEYSCDTWYTVDYFLDLEDINNPKQAMQIKDESGNTLVCVIKDISIGTKSGLTGLSQNEFALSHEANSYGLIFAATSRLDNYPHWNGNRAQSGSKIYLDDMKFGDVDPLIFASAEDEYINSTVPVSGARIKGVFNYGIDGETVTDTSVSVSDTSGKVITDFSVEVQNGEINVTLGELEPSKVYRIAYNPGFKSISGDSLTETVYQYVRSKDKLEVVNKSFNNGKAEITVKNNTDTEEKMTFVFALQKDGQNVSSQLKFKNTVVPPDSSVTLSIEGVVLPEDYSEDKYSLNGYLIGGFDKLNAYSDVIKFN